MKCMAPDCNVHYILVEMDDGNGRIVLCPNHVLIYSGNLFNNVAIDPLPSELNEHIHCEICDKPGIYYRDPDVVVYLCKEHLFRWNTLNLSPQDFYAMYHRLGNVFMLHEDFYDSETGEALQPRTLIRRFS